MRGVKITPFEPRPARPREERVERAVTSSRRGLESRGIHAVYEPNLLFPLRCDMKKPENENKPRQFENSKPAEERWPASREEV